MRRDKASLGFLQRFKIFGRLSRTIQKTCLCEYAQRHSIQNREKRAAQKCASYWRRGGRELKPAFAPNATSKACSKCTRIKPLAEFGLDSRYSNGRRSECKSCSLAQQTAWRNANTEHVKAQAGIRRTSDSYKAHIRERAPLPTKKPIRKTE